MQEKTIDIYLMKTDEHMQAEGAHAQYPQPRGVILLEANEKEEEEDFNMEGPSHLL